LCFLCTDFDFWRLVFGDFVHWFRLLEPCRAVPHDNLSIAGWRDSLFLGCWRLLRKGLRVLD